MSRPSFVALASCFVFATLVAAFGPFTSGVARADDETAAPQARAKDAGSIEGQVVSVDYRASKFTVKAGSATYDVVVLPSTDFQGPNNSFHGIADIKKGAHLEVLLSQRAGTYTAQIVHLK